MGTTKCFISLDYLLVITMTQFLPPNLLALFAPRDPIPYLPPAAKLPHEKNNPGYAGVAQFMTDFEVCIFTRCLWLMNCWVQYILWFWNVFFLGSYDFNQSPWIKWIWWILFHFWLLLIFSFTSKTSNLNTQIYCVICFWSFAST